jgi:hypothetical protein
MKAIRSFKENPKAGMQELREDKKEEAKKN